MALTRNDKRVILVALTMAVIVVGGVAWLRMSNRQGVETSAVPGSSLLAQFQTPSPQPFQVGAKKSPPPQPDQREVTPSQPEQREAPPSSPAEPPGTPAVQGPPGSQAPQAAAPPAQPEPQGAPAGPQAPQAVPGAPASPQDQGTPPGSQAPQAAESAPTGPQEPQAAAPASQTEAAQPPQAAQTGESPLAAPAPPPDEAPCVSNESGSNSQEEQAQDQAATLRRAEDELRHAEFTLKQKEREVEKKPGAPVQSSPAPKHGAARYVVNSVTLNETDHELIFTVHGVTGAANPQVMLIGSPSRLVIDLPGPSWVYRGSKTLQGALVRGLRTGKTPERLRLVADLADMPGWGQPVVEASPEGIVIRVNKPAQR